MRPTYSTKKSFGDSKKVKVYFNDYERLKFYGLESLLKSIDDAKIIEASVFIGLGGRLLTMNLGCYTIKEKGIYFAEKIREITSLVGDYKLQTTLDNEIKEAIQEELEYLDLDIGLVFFGAVDTDGFYWSPKLAKKLARFVVACLIEMEVSPEELNRLLYFS